MRDLELLAFTVGLIEGAGFRLIIRFAFHNKWITSARSDIWAVILSSAVFLIVMSAWLLVPLAAVGLLPVSRAGPRGAVYLGIGFLIGLVLFAGAAWIRDKKRRR